jgi:hypothetical protein
VVIAEPAPRTASFEVVLPTGVTVRVGPSFDSAALARLLEVLSRVAAC